MVLETKCPKCGLVIEYTAEHVGGSYDCPTCNSPVKLPTTAHSHARDHAGEAVPESLIATRVQLQESQRKALIEDARIPAANTLPTPKQRLKALRANTCYGVLRQVINAIAFLCFGFCGLWIISGFLFTTVSPFIGSMWLIPLGCIAVVLIEALREASLVLVDMADAMVVVVKNEV